jgi:hypothetical protein
MRPTPALLALTLILGGTAACLPSAPPPEPAQKVQDSPPLPAGSYEIQSIAYDDADGAYRVFLVNPPPGRPPVYVATSLQMARLTDAEVAAGRKSARLDVDQPAPPGAATAGSDEVAPDAIVAGAVARLPQDFAIQYTHNVVEMQGGQPVVVRQESSTWSPFMSAMAGAAVGNMLFGPRYYFPPPYMGGAMTGFGGAGATPAAAAQSYTQQHGKPPQPTKLSQSGYAKAPSSSLKSTGTGAGTSRLKPSTSPPTKAPKRSFGGGFGRRR